MKLVAFIFLLLLGFRNNRGGTQAEAIKICGYGYAMNISNTPARVQISEFFRAPDTHHRQWSDDHVWLYRVFPSYASALFDRTAYINSYLKKGIVVQQGMQFKDMCK
ncbi:MAG: hypothetical protein JST43_04175 [Bacteroidetes bacterium]|nr:hypothetical protein [Bacteroidota bacterium]MBS1539981.1 hypothetical protein [Bacteroidota bacterium]